ncbi:hypothetical protein CY35_02G145900 [Sphagnum magellanicum]|nr:hypothetical protein CY35_02G145900 [Sphagnum magellanicum]
MAEVSHGTGGQTLEDGGLQEVCAILKAGGIGRLDFDGPGSERQDRWSVYFGERHMDIPCGLEVEYTDLMQAIGESTGLESIFITQNFSLCNEVLCVQLCKALCKNHSVSKLIIHLTVDGSQDCQPNFDILLNQVVVLLESNVGLKEFHFDFRPLHAPTFWSLDGFANALERNRTLERFCLAFNYLPSEQELQRLVQPLIADGNGQQKNSTLITLDLLLHERVEEESLTVAVNVLAKMLQNNSSLKELRLWAPESWYSVDSFAEALETNHTLEQLHLTGRRLNLQRLLQPLTMDANGQQSNATLLKLGLIVNTGKGDDDMQLRMSAVVDPLTKMLQSNSSLKELDWRYSEGFTESDVCALIKSLENNYSLEVLDLKYCDGVSDSVFPVIMDMLVVNKTLKDIRLDGTELARKGKTQVVKQELEKNAVYMSQLKELPLAKATSARVFLCGYPYAGKTTLRKGLVRCLAHGSTFSKIFLTPIMDFLSKLKDGLRQTQRTHGIEIRELKVTEGVNLSIWDMAGQEEFHAFHDFMLPNLDGTSYPSLFLLVCNPCKHLQGNLQEAILNIQGELDYWLRFIASKNRRSNIFKPKAIVVFTHSDKIDVNAHVLGVVRDLKRKFVKVVDVASKPVTIDSHSSRSAHLVVKLIQENVQALLNTLPPVYEVCITMRLALKAWVSNHPNSPLMDQNTFSKLCLNTMLPWLIKNDQRVIDLAKDERIKLNENRNKAVAKCLHTSGDIIFFEDLDFVVVDVDWFCHQVMGHLIKFSYDQVQVTNHVRLPLTNQDGFTTEECLQHFLDDSIKFSCGRKLQNVQTKQLIQLMLRLELCFEGTCGPSEYGLFIPSTLASHNITSHNVLAPWKWQQVPGRLKNPVYFGRRLKCDDQACTFIPHGFFCRLQVSLHNEFLSSDNQMTADYTFKENAISILYDGIEIVVEFDNDVSSHIDVLVRSSEKEYDEALDIVHERITKHIQTLRGAFDGCQGIILLEGIVRKECVEHPLSFKSRLDQAILVEDLKKRILANGSKWQSWQHTWGELNLENKKLNASFEIAIKMLGSEERNDVWQRLAPEFKSHELNQNLVITQSNFGSHQRAFASTSSQEGIQDLHKDLKAIHKDVKILVKSKMRKVPRFYLFTTEGLKQTLVAKLGQGIKVVQLHLLCECRMGLHKVKGKEGCEVIIEDQQWQKIHAVILEGLKWVVPFIKAGLHITMGLGNIIPNPAEVGLNVIGTTFNGSVQDWASITQDQLQVGVESDEKEAAEQWLVDFLRTKVILKDFGLQRVLYLDNQGQTTGEVAWLCEEHLSQGEQKKELVTFPR